MPRVYPSIDGKTTNHALPPSLVEIVAGFSAGVVSTIFVHPFDVVKTRLQVDMDSATRVGGAVSIIKQIHQREGFFPGFYRGITPNLIGNSVSWAIYFMVYGQVKDMFYAYRGGNRELQALDYFAASGLSGIVTAFATNPIWVVKTRMLSTSKSAPGAYLSMKHGISSMYRSEGLRGFYRGLVPSLFGVSHGAVQFMAYEKLKIWRMKRRARKLDVEITVPSAVEDATDTLKGRTQPSKVVSTPVAELSNFDYLTLSAASKMFAGSITYPYQVLRARLQTYDASARYNGAVDLIQQIWRREGMAGFYKGLAPNLVRVLPSTCVTFLVYENTKIYFPRLYEAEGTIFARHT